MPKDTEIYYADESGFEEHYSRNYGYAPSNERVYGNTGRTSVVSALKDNELVAPFVFSGYMNGGLFEGGLEPVFVPCLTNPKKHHRKGAILDIAPGYEFGVIFLPKYPPGLNPIETTWAIIKNKLRLHMHEFDSFSTALFHAFNGRLLYPSFRLFIAYIGYFLTFTRVSHLLKSNTVIPSFQTEFGISQYQIG